MPAAARMPKIVFFGPPQSGKSSLIAAVVHTLTSTPGATVTTLDGSAATTNLRRELIPHRVQVSGSVIGPKDAVYEFIDCDGAAVAEMLRRDDTFLRGRVRSVLAEAVQSADALVVIFDATDQLWEHTEGLQQFRQFIDELADERTLGRAVGGLPVILTLTKCDALSRPGDSPSHWQRRFEDQLDKLVNDFSRYFGKRETNESNYFDFGSLVVSSVATGKTVPSGPSFAIYADEETGYFQVRKFSKLILESAFDHDSREARSNARLKRTVWGTSVLTFLMLFGLIVLTLTGGFEQGNRLADRVRNYQAQEGPPADRLADKRLSANLKTLTALKNDADYGTLPSELRGFVDDRLREVNEYLLFRAKFQPPKLGPAEIRTWEQAEQLKRELQSNLAAPKEFQTTWQQTEIEQLREKWLKDLALSRVVQEQFTEQLRGQIRRANELILTTKPPDYSWRGLVQETIRDGDTLPKPAQESIPGSPTVPGRRGKALTYDTIYESERVTTARRDWIDTRNRLRCLRDLADATGLSSGPDAGPAVFDLPEPQALPQQDLATQRLTAFLSAYAQRGTVGTSGPAQFPEWYEAGIPEAIRTTIERRLLSIRDTAYRHLRGLLRNEAAGGMNFTQAAQSWAAKTGSGAWEEFCLIIESLLAHEPPSRGPVQELVQFTKQTTFTIPGQLIVEVPDDLLAVKATPTGNLTLSIKPKDGKAREVIYQTTGEPTRERPLTRYNYTTANAITVAPGDGVMASLALRSGTNDYRLSWETSRSTVYLFDALTQMPKLEKLGAIPTPYPARATRLRALPPATLPRLPVLFPESVER